VGVVEGSKPLVLAHLSLHTPRVEIRIGPRSAYEYIRAAGGRLHPSIRNPRVVAACAMGNPHLGLARTREKTPIPGV
jgi:hypothetical protein